MAKRRTPKRIPEGPQPGRGDGKGRAFNPTELPAEEAKADNVVPTPMPQGCPVPPEEYRRLKGKARKQPLPPAPSAQEDSSARSGGG